MESFEAGTRKVLILKVDGQLHAYDGVCPHQSAPLVEGRFDGHVLTCRAHEWTFDACTGKGINPKGACLRKYPVKIACGRVFVAVGPSRA